MTSFAAGMLLGISLLHIIPEANHIYSEYIERMQLKEEATAVVANAEIGKNLRRLRLGNVFNSRKTTPNSMTSPIDKTTKSH